MALNSNKKAFDLGVEDRFKKQLFGEPTRTDTDTHTYTDTYTYVEKEKRTKRLNLLAQPSVHQKLDEYAKAHGDTFNNLVHTLMERFIEENDL